MVRTDTERDAALHPKDLDCSVEEQGEQRTRNRGDNDEQSK